MKGNNTLSMDSNLPYAIEIHAPSLDEAPVTFACAGDNWSSGDSTHCDLGVGTMNGYKGGTRSSRCGFHQDGSLYSA